MVTKFVPKGSQCTPNNGGDYCCSNCKEGRGHGRFCHKIVHPDMEDGGPKLIVEVPGKRDAGPPAKYLQPLWCRSLQLCWTDRSVAERAAAFDDETHRHQASKAAVLIVVDVLLATGYPSSSIRSPSSRARTPGSHVASPTWVRSTSSTMYL